jgi:hypothetical protein
MDREMTLKNLAEAEDHAVLGERHLSQQRALVERLTRNGNEAARLGRCSRRCKIRSFSISNIGIA